MIENFSAYSSLLVKLGNTRLPYTILVDSRQCIDYAEVCLSMPITKTIITVDDVRVPFGTFDAVVQCSYPEIANNVLACKDLVCIVIASLDINDSYLSVLFNEVHTDNLVLRNFALVKSYDKTNVYVRKLIDDPNIIAINPKSCISLLTDAGFIPWKPWHTIILHKDTKEALQIVWDTRIIVGYAKLNDEAYNAVLHAQNANDNCTMLYKAIDFQSTAFDNIITDSLI